MAGEYDEDHWYGKIGWPRLRKKIEQVAQIQADAFFSALNDRDRSEDRKLVDAFVADIIMTIGEIAERQVSARIADTDQESGLHPSSGMWSFALPLFGDAEKLADAIEKEVALLRGFTNRDVNPRAALGKIMNSFLENARRG